MSISGKLFRNRLRLGKPFRNRFRNHFGKSE